MVAEVQRFQRQIERHTRENERLRQWERRKSINNGIKAAVSMDSLLSTSATVAAPANAADSDYGSSR